MIAELRGYSKEKLPVCTIQKLVLALDGANRHNFRKQLEPLRYKRIVFIFDECHRSQFGENHKAIKQFFPNSQLFGFTGTPIFEENASRVQIEDKQASLKTTADLFQKRLHADTITNAIEDANVLRFHVDYFNLKARTRRSRASRSRNEPLSRPSGQNMTPPQAAAGSMHCSLRRPSMTRSNASACSSNIRRRYNNHRMGPTCYHIVRRPWPGKDFARTN